MKTPPTSRTRCAQRGVASLIVVMVLLFVAALVAAYTSRNLIFEQRTSTNQYRSTQALEAAEAGLEWAIAMLGQGRITDSCATSTNVADATMRQRYFSINASDGAVTIQPSHTASSAYPTCVWGASDWSCSCPTNTAPSVTAPTGNAVHPAFRVRFSTTLTGPRPGTVRVDVNGCTALNETCLQFPNAAGVAYEGRASISALVALASGLAATPTAAVTAGGTVNAGNLLGLNVYNPEPRSGVTIQAHGPVTTGSMNLVSLPGTPPGSGTVVGDDANLPGDDPERMFASVFNMYRSVYRQQPGAKVLTCSPCSASILRTAASLNPGRVLWVNGDVNLDSAGAIGSTGEPVMIYVNGNVDISNASVTVFGVIYSNAANWSLGGSGTVIGALVAERNLDGSSTATVVYDSTVVDAVHYTTGSFVRVPGGWKDF